MDAGGSGLSTDEDRKSDFDKSKMFMLLERKRHSKTLIITLPTKGANMFLSSVVG